MGEVRKLCYERITGRYFLASEKDLSDFIEKVNDGLIYSLYGYLCALGLNTKNALEWSMYCWDEPLERFDIVWSVMEDGSLGVRIKAEKLKPNFD